MTIIIHVLIALTSIILASIACLQPTVAKLRRSYVFIALTFISGFYLVWTTSTPIDRISLSGIAYLSVVTAITVLTHQRLKLAQSKS